MYILNKRLFWTVGPCLSNLKYRAMGMLNKILQAPKYLITDSQKLRVLLAYDITSFISGAHTQDKKTREILLAHNNFIDNIKPQSVQNIVQKINVSQLYILLCVTDFFFF